MLGKLLSFFGFFFKMWSAIPDSAKKKIIDLIVEGFDAILRGFYKTYNDQQEKEDEEKKEKENA